MFSNIRSFFYRHRRKFFLTGVIFGGALLATRYLQKTIRDLQAKETIEFLDRKRKQQHYESIEKACNKMAVTLSGTLREAILKLVDTDELVAQLHGSTVAKVPIWKELKVLAFAKIGVFVYSSALIVVFLRAQLSLIGGYMFRSASGDTDVAQSSFQEKYLALCHFLIEEGVKRITHLVEDKMRLIMAGRSLKEELTLHEVEQIFWSLQSAIGRDSRNPCHCASHYLLPNTVNLEGFSRPQADQFNRILLETRDLIESEEVSSLLNTSVSRGFASVMDRIAEFYVPIEGNGLREPQPGPSTRPDTFFASNIPTEEFPNVAKVGIPLAKVIPIVDGLGTGDIGAEIVQLLVRLEALKVFAANVYEAFCVQ